MDITNTPTVQDFTRTFGRKNDGNLMLDENNRLVRINRGQSDFTRAFIYRQHDYTVQMDRKVREALLAALSKEYNLNAVTDYARKQLGLDKDPTQPQPLLERRNIKQIIENVKAMVPECRRGIRDKFQQLVDIGKDGKGVDDEMGQPSVKGKAFLREILSKVNFNGGQPKDYDLGPLNMRILKEVRAVCDRYGDMFEEAARSDRAKELVVNQVYKEVTWAAQQFVDRLNEYQERYMTALKSCAETWSGDRQELKAALDEFIAVQPKIWTEADLCELELDANADSELDDTALSPDALEEACKVKDAGLLVARRSDDETVKDCIVSKYKEFAEFKGAVEGDAAGFANMTGEMSKAWYDGLAGRLFEKAVDADAGGQFMSLASTLHIGKDDLKSWFVADLGQRLAEKVAGLATQGGLSSKAKVDLVAEYVGKGVESFKTLSRVLSTAVSPVSLDFSSVEIGDSLNRDEIEMAGDSVKREVRGEVGGLMRKFFAKEATLDATVRAIEDCVNSGQRRLEKMIDACVRLSDRRKGIVDKIEAAIIGEAERLLNDPANKGFGDAILKLRDKGLKGDSILNAVKERLRLAIVAYVKDPKGKPLPQSEQEIEDYFCKPQMNHFVQNAKLTLDPLREKSKAFIRKAEKCEGKINDVLSTCESEVKDRLLAIMQEDADRLYGIKGLTKHDLLESDLHERCSILCLVPRLTQLVKAEGKALMDICNRAMALDAKGNRKMELLDDAFEKRLEHFRGDFIPNAINKALEAWQQSKKVYEAAFDKVESRLKTCLGGAKNRDLRGSHEGMTEKQLAEYYNFTFEKFFADNQCYMPRGGNAYKIPPHFEFGERILFDLVLSTVQKLQDMAFGIGSEKDASDEGTIIASLEKSISDGILAANQAHLKDEGLNSGELNLFANATSRIVNDRVKERIGCLKKDIADLRLSTDPNDQAMADRLEPRMKRLQLMQASEVRELLVERFMASFAMLAEDRETYHVRTELKDMVDDVIRSCVEFYYGSDDADEPSLAVRIHHRLLDRGSPELIEGEGDEVKTDWFYSHRNENGETVRDRVDAFMINSLKEFVRNPNFDTKAFFSGKLPDFVDGLIKEVQSVEHAKEKEALRDGIRNAREKMTQTAISQIAALRLGDVSGLFASKSPLSFTLGDVFAGTDGIAKMVAKAVSDLEAKKLEGVLHDGEKYKDRIGMTTFEKFSEKNFVAQVVKTLGENPTVKALVERAKDNLADVNRFCADHHCEKLKTTFAKEIHDALVEDLKTQLSEGTLLKPNAETPKKSVLERVVGRRNEKSPFAEAVANAAKSDYNDYVEDVKTGNGHRLLENAVDELLKDLSSMKSARRGISLHMPADLRTTLMQRYEKAVLDRADARFEYFKSLPDDKDKKAKARKFDWATDGEQFVKAVSNAARNAVRASLLVLDSAYDHIDGYNQQVIGKNLMLVDPLLAKRESFKQVESETLKMFLSNERQANNYLQKAGTQKTVNDEFAKWVNGMVLTKGLLGDLQADAPAVKDLCKRLFDGMDLSMVYDGKRLSDVKEILDVLANTVKLNANQTLLGEDGRAMGPVVYSMIPGVLARAREIQPEGVITLQTVWHAFFGPKAKVPASGVDLSAAFGKAVNDKAMRDLPKEGFFFADVPKAARTAFVKACQTGLCYEAAVKQASDPSRMVGSGEVMKAKRPLGMSGESWKSFVVNALNETFNKAVAEERGSDYAKLSGMEQIKRDQDARKGVTAKYVESLVTEEEFDEACRVEMIKSLSQDLLYDLQSGLVRSVNIGGTQYFTTADLVAQTDGNTGVDLRKELTTRLESAYQKLLAESPLKGAMKPRQLIQALSLLARRYSGSYFRAFQDAFATGKSQLNLSITDDGNLVARLEHENKPESGTKLVTASDVRVEISPAGEVRLTEHTATSNRKTVSYVRA